LVVQLPGARASEAGNLGSALKLKARIAKTSAILGSQPQARCCSYQQRALA
jgi:hypothetical protein